jgi:succinate dehydrogenase / fumarate reductase flavoprotein subunit
VKEQLNRFVSSQGTVPVDDFHRRLGRIMWDNCGMARNKEGLTQAIADIASLREEFYAQVRVPGTTTGFNPELDKAGRVADFLELGELMCKDALEREESCGGHFREEFQTEEGEALRRDDEFTFVSAWEHQGNPSQAKLHQEELVYENIELKQRSYK